MEEELKAIKQALSFLLDQENIRQQELNALNEKIDALSGNFNERDKAFSDWVDDREFKDFDSAYGEKLKPYSETMRKIRQDDYDLARDVYNTYRDSDKDLSPEEFIDSTISALDKYLEDIGIPKGTAVEVKADLNGDGKPETVVAEKTTVETEKVEEKSDDDKEDNEDKDFMDSINAAVDKELAKK